jgi:hypothetical protein
MALSAGSKFHGVRTRPAAPAVVYAFGAAGTGAVVWKGFRALGGRAEVRAKSRHLHLGSPGRYIQLGEQASAQVTADADPAALADQARITPHHRR